MQAAGGDIAMILLRLSTPLTWRLVSLGGNIAVDKATAYFHTDGVNLRRIGLLFHAACSAGTRTL